MDLDAYNFKNIEKYITLIISHLGNDDINSSANGR